MKNNQTMKVLRSLALGALDKSMAKIENDKFEEKSDARKLTRAMEQVAKAGAVFGKSKESSLGSLAAQPKPPKDNKFAKNIPFLQAIQKGATDSSKNRLPEVPEQNRTRSINQATGSSDVA